VIKFVYILVFTIVIVPIYSFFDIVSMPTREFQIISGIKFEEKKAGYCKILGWKLLFFVLENLNLTIFFRTQNSDYFRVRRKHLINLQSSLIQNLIQTFLKSYMIFQSNKTIGFWLSFTITKSFLMFSYFSSYSLPQMLPTSPKCSPFVPYFMVYSLGLCAILVPFALSNFYSDMSEHLVSQGFSTEIQPE
jgi:hypothetical protein